MRIAVAGPDGSGKSSVCKNMNQHLPNSVVIYAGKREFILTSTKVGLKIWVTLSKYGTLANVFARFFIYYPLEIIENFIKFSKDLDGKENYIYERHPIDRVMMKYELKQRFKRGKVKPIRYWTEYFLLTLFSIVYVNVFPRLNHVFILLPTPELCFDRAGGQYKHVEDALMRIEAYRKAVQEWKYHEDYFTLIEITSEVDLPKIKQIIINNLPKDTKESNL